MGEVRAFSSHVRWSSDEAAILVAHYPTATLDQLMAILPGRTVSQIQNKAFALGVSRLVKPARTIEETRAAKREFMARRRAENPEAARAYHRERHHKNHEVNKAKMRAYAAKRFFWNREMHLRGADRATAKQLAALWKSQRGLCGLTGRRLDRSAQLDHIKAKAKGGGDEIGNLRWVCPAINYAKRDMSDDQLIAMCADVIAWIGRRIQAVESISEQAEAA